MRTAPVDISRKLRSAGSRPKHSDNETRKNHVAAAAAAAAPTVGANLVDSALTLLFLMVGSPKPRHNKNTCVRR